jgi:hypothetical protein
MANDPTLALRQAVIVTARADTDLIALVPAERNYGMRSPPDPAYPFTRYGSPDALPFRAQCIDGASIAFMTHTFSQGEFEDECAAINAAYSKALDGQVLALDGGGRATIIWKGSQIIPDAAEADVWHGINRFEATVVA